MKITLLACIFFLMPLAGNETFEALHQLQGTWRMKTKNGALYEAWRKWSDTQLRCKSYKVIGTDTTLLEQVTLADRDGDIFYIPVVENQNNRQPVEFRLVKAQDHVFTFENKLHDYPQRIIYHLVSKDSVVARIEGTNAKGQQKSSNYYFSRVAP